MDVLSDVLLAVRLTGAIFFDVEARSPFAAETPAMEAIAKRVMAGAGHVISFHIVTEGVCWAGPSPRRRDRGLSDGRFQRLGFGARDARDAR